MKNKNNARKQEAGIVQQKSKVKIIADGGTTGRMMNMGRRWRWIGTEPFLYCTLRPNGWKAFQLAHRNV